jgi:hypothetical protein
MYCNELQDVIAVLESKRVEVEKAITNSYRKSLDSMRRFLTSLLQLVSTVHGVDHPTSNASNK